MLIDETNVAHAIEKLKTKKAGGGRGAAASAGSGAAGLTVHDGGEQGAAATAGRGAAKGSGVAPGAGAGSVAPVASRNMAAELPTVAGAKVLGMPGWLAGQLNGGGLVRGAVTSMADCPAAVIDMLAHVTANGGCAAVVGYPRLALAAIAAAGGDLSRLIIVPDPAPHAGAVLSTLAEGVDMVVYVPANRVTPTFARPVEARLRKSNCALVSCGVAWPGARLNIDLRVAGVHGLGWGSGRIRSVGVAGRVWGKGQPPQSVVAELTGRRGCVGAGAAGGAEGAGGEEVAAAGAGAVAGAGGARARGGRGQGRDRIEVAL